MKVLKYIGIVVLVILVLFFGKGLLTPSISYESKIVVDKPAEEVWGVLSDNSKVSDWLTSITKMEHITGEPGAVGAVSHIYVVENGEEMMMEETITAVKAKEHMAMTFTMDFMDMDYEMFLKETNGKTEIITKSITKGNGLFAKSILSFMTSSMKAQEDENLNNLKGVIKSNTTDYSL